MRSSSDLASSWVLQNDKDHVCRGRCGESVRRSPSNTSHRNSFKCALLRMLRGFAGLDEITFFPCGVDGSHGCWCSFADRGRHGVLSSGGAAYEDSIQTIGPGSGSGSVRLLQDMV